MAVRFAGLVSLASLFGCTVALAGDPPASPAAAPLPDPAPVRLKLLSEMDARIDEACARAHLEARLLLDETMPIAFFGVDVDQVQGGMKALQVYRGTSAAAAGLQVGDVITEFAGVRSETKAILFQTIRRHPVGGTVEVKALRDGREMSFTATLGARPEEDEEDEEQFPDLTPPPFVTFGLPARFDFEKDALGAAPAGLDAILGGHGRAPRFEIVRGDAGQILRQQDDDPTSIRYPIALAAGVDATDVVARIRFRFAGGIIDRAAGIVLHYKDASNYLVARVNAAENDLRVFRMSHGLRRTLPGGLATIDVKDEKWHKLEFRCEGPKVTAVLDGTITTTSYDTDFSHGRVGIWTKSDSITEFDDLTFTAP